MAKHQQWDGLKPQNVVQAAHEDIKRRERNELRAAGKILDDYEHYAFMREHVRNADGPFGLIQDAIDAIDNDAPKDPENSIHSKLLRSTKRTMRHLYDTSLLRAALKMEKPR